MEDAQTSLKINKEILFSHFGTSSTPEKSFIEDIRKENYRLSEKINWLFQEKAETAKMIYKIQQELDNKQRIERELIEREKTKYFVDDNKLMEKEFKITYLLKQLENKKKGNCAVYIGDPNKFNVEMNSELEATRALIRKYTSLLQKEKQYAIVQSEKIKQLESIINGSKAKQNNQNEEDNIEVIDCVFSSNDDSDILEEDIEECEGDNNSDNNKDKENHKIDDENIQFPEKIKRIKTEQSKGVPKLDLSTVLSKYKKPDNLQIVDKIKKTNRSSDEYIEKLKGQIKIFKATIVRYKARITKLKQSLVALKNQNTLLQQTLKLSNTYNNNTTHAITNAVNESMVSFIYIVV